MEDHDKALRILVHKLKDFGAAENYCEVNVGGKDDSHRKRLYHILLSVYLDPTYEFVHFSLYSLIHFHCIINYTVMLRYTKFFCPTISRLFFHKIYKLTHL